MEKSYAPLAAKIRGVNGNHNLSPSEASVLSAFPYSVVDSRVSYDQSQLEVASFAAVACGDDLVDVIHLPFDPLENDQDACCGNKGDVSFDSSTPVQTVLAVDVLAAFVQDRKSTRLNSSHVAISYAVFCLKKKKRENHPRRQTL